MAEKYAVDDEEKDNDNSDVDSDEVTDDEDKESSQFSESSEEEDDASDTGLTENQNRLLYLISLYTNIAQSDEEAEEWIRKSACLVMTYEGIVQQVFDYDYKSSIY